MSEPTTLRESIESLVDETEHDTPAVDIPQDEPIHEREPAETGAEPAEASAQGKEPQQDLNALAEGEDDTKTTKERDEGGRFKAKQAAEEGIKPGPKSGPKPQGERAPASWRPDVREHWAQLPEPVRAEVGRREVEVQRTLQESAEARKGFEAIMRTIAPYEMFIKAENSTPVQAIDNLMRTGAQLRVGTPTEKASLVAGIVKQYGIDIQLLDSALAGNNQAVDPQSAAIDQVINQRLAPMQLMLSQYQQAQQHQQQQVAMQAQTEVQNFLSKAEFGNDVREDMADILETANRRGITMSMSDAYRKACLLSDTVRPVLIQRQKAAGAKQSTQVAQRARQAAVSVSGSAPVGGLTKPATDVRSAIEAAIVQQVR